MNYFSGITTTEELKKEYWKLAKMNHPDCGGDTATMTAINKAYDKAFAVISETEQWQEKNTADKKEWRTASGINLNDIQDDGYKAAIEVIIKLHGLKVELCGAWIWVTGQTREYREALKAAGYFWASKKLAWYWRPLSEKRKNYRGKNTLEDIRRKYGSQTIIGSRHEMQEAI